MGNSGKIALKRKLDSVFGVLDSNTPERIVFLQEETDWKFLMLVILSAQCSDKKVMSIKDALFSKFDALEKLAAAEASEIEDVIRTLGLYRSKAANMRETARILIRDHAGKVPQDFEALTRLPGVGRKTANCVRGEVFHLPAIICDTHFIRLANRLGFANTNDPLKVERLFAEILEPDRQYRFSMSANFFGRNTCKSANPQCEGCILSQFCGFHG